LAAALVVTAAVFIGVPAWELLVPGPFDWHVRTAAYWQGGLEALALIALCAAGFASRRTGWLIVLVALPAFFFLRRHAVDVALLVDAVQLEVVIGLGMTLRRLLRLPAAQSSLDYLLAFVSGFAVWSVCAWTASALGAGSIRSSLWLALLLAMVALCGGHRPLLLFLWSRVRSGGTEERAWSGALAAWLLILFARARVVMGFDTQWYGLRSEHVLVPGHSVYEPLGLTSPVFYFPKIYEVFLLPLGAVKDYAAIEGFSILVLLLLLMACRLLLRALGAPPRTQLPLVALVATLPAVANYAIEAKPDLLATLLVVVAALLAWHATQTRSRAALVWMLTCVALACSAKLTAIPYAGMVLLATAAALWRSRDRAPSTQARALSSRWAWVTFALAAIAAVLVMARTWKLTGVPTIGPDPLFKLWLALGLHLREPAGTLAWTSMQDWTDVPALIVDWLFRPQVLGHIVVGWTGNVWLWFALIAAGGLVAGRRRSPIVPGSTWPLWALIVTGIALALGNRYMVRGGDGNYFLFALVPGIACAGAAAFARTAASPRLFAIALASLPAFALFQASYSFASAAWTPGTRAFDLHLGDSPRATAEKRLDILSRHGLGRIGAFLDTLPHCTHVSGLVEAPTQFWLPACVEDFSTVWFSRPAYMDSAASIRRFLRDQQIAYVILPRSEIGELKGQYAFAQYVDVAAELAALPGVRRIDDSRYYLLDLSRIDPATLSPDEPTATSPVGAR